MRNGILWEYFQIVKTNRQTQTRASWERALRVTGREDGCLAAPDLPICACLAPTHNSWADSPVNNVDFCRVLSDVERDQVSSCVCACVCQPLSAHSHQRQPRHSGLAVTGAQEVLCTNSCSWSHANRLWCERPEELTHTNELTPASSRGASRRKEPNGTAPLFNVTIFFYYRLYKFIENYKETHTPTDKIA